uniref:Uncharacterized protein n=1 Tax=Knipowitschia caucasica TaxID=637954 RepID=A0AAV2JRM4_KNICA
MEPGSCQKLDTTQKSLREIDRLKQQVINERRLRRKSWDEMAVALARLKDMAAKASQAKARENHLQEEVEKLKRRRAFDSRKYLEEDTIPALQVAHQMRVQELKKELEDVKFGLLNRTKRIICCHKIQLDQQAKAKQDVEDEMRQVREEKTSLLL